MKKRLLVTTLLVATFCSSGYYLAKGPDTFQFSQRMAGTWPIPGSIPHVESPSSSDKSPLDQIDVDDTTPPGSALGQDQTKPALPPALNDQQAQATNSSPESQVENLKPDPGHIAPATKEISSVGEKDYDYNSFFKNSLFIGDSITEGIAFYEFLPEENVYSKLGLTLRKAYHNLDEIDLVHPSEIYLMFGANDLEENAKDEFYLDNYRQLISALHAKWPQADVYIQSILPLKQGVEEKYQNLSNARIATINDALANLVTELDGVYYVDLSSVRRQFTDAIYETDGIHYKKDFYPSWLNYLVTSVKS